MNLNDPSPTDIQDLLRAHARAAYSLKHEVREALENAEKITGPLAIIWFVETTTKAPSLAVIGDGPDSHTGLNASHALGDIMATVMGLAEEWEIPMELIMARVASSREKVRVRMVAHGSD